MPILKLIIQAIQAIRLLPFRRRATNSISEESGTSLSNRSGQYSIDQIDRRTVLIGLAIIFGVLILALIAYYFMTRKQIPPESPIVEPQTEEKTLPQSALDATYTVNGERVALSNGSSDNQAAPGSAGRIKISATGTPASGDLNSDLRDDAAMFLIEENPGTGTFYYAAAATQNRDGSWAGGEAFYLGDRVALKSMSIKDGVLTVNYADRRPGETMSTSPSVNVTKYLRLLGSRFDEILPPGETQK